MLRVVLVGVAFALLSVPAFAYQSRCVGPYAPVVPDPHVSSKGQIDATRPLVVQFIKQSDDYQECLLLDLKTERETATRKQKKLDPQIESDIQNMIAANQREKERVGAAYNGAIKSWHELHPQQTQ